MTWRRAVAYWAVFLALAAYYAGAVRETPQPAAQPARAVFLDIPAAQIDTLELRRDTRVVRCRRRDGRWEVAEPTGRSVPADLIEALVATLTQLPDVEIVAETGTTAGEFGLQTPQSEMTLAGPDRPPVTVRLGAHNPAGTAVYAQRSDSPRVFLIGLNVRYYEDLLFEALGRQGS
jgi:hypothetical protein